METNIDCEHDLKSVFGPFCTKCGCIYVRSSLESGTTINSFKYKNFICKHEIPPIETFHHIEKSIGYKIYFKKVKSQMSDFYKKARISCVKYIKKLVEEYKFSVRSYFLAVFYLDLIYLNYDYFTILKDFKSELMAIGCFLVASKKAY